jgi:hypothetical protein
MSEREVEQSSDASSVRWQQQAVAHLSFTINLFIGLATASLGLAFGWMTTSRSVSGSARCLLLVGVSLMLVSLFSGCGATVSRLLDFRKTAQVARQREGSATSGELADLRKSTEKLGEATWRLFWLEIGSFLGAVVTLVTSVIVASS